MSKIVETIISRFDGGVTDDPRDKREGVSQITTNFNAFSSPFRLLPYRDSEDGNSSQSDIIIRNFVIALRTGTTYSLYGLGVTTGTNQGEVYYKDLTTGAANDLDDATWTETVNNVTGGGNVVTSNGFNLFVYYPRTNYIYFAQSGTHIVRYDPDGGDAIATTHNAVTHSDIGQGIVHSKDDILYIPYYNAGGFIMTNNNGTWNNTALTLPVHYNPVSICEYGNYLAIGCRHVDGVSNSRVFLWDRDSTLTTLSESIDWGEGLLSVLEEVDGELVGISLYGNSNTVFANKIIFRQLLGNKAVKFKELIVGGSSSELPRVKQKVDNRLYFMMEISLYGSTREGVWSVGRTPGQPLTIVHERTPNNNTVLTNGLLRNFFKVGDFLFQVFEDNAIQTMSKTNDTASFTATSIYESKIVNDGDASKEKQLLGISVMHEFLPSGASVVVRYKKDEESSFTTIMTSDTDNDVSKSAVNIESSGAELPSYKEITWRIESTGNAVITGLSWKSMIKDSRPYA